jgi:hypothetical protein
VGLIQEEIEAQRKHYNKIKKVLKDDLKLYCLYRKNKEIKQTEEFKLFSRMLKEQTRKSIK